MDPLSIGASCIAVLSAAAQASKLVRDFLRKRRDARSDLGRLNREISDLELVLQSLRDVENEGYFSKAGVPSRMQDQLIALVDNCNRVLTEIQSILDEYIPDGSGAKWALFGKKRVDDQVVLLESHRKALDLSLTTIDFSLSCSIKADTAALLASTEEDREKLQEILRLVKLLPGTMEQEGTQDSEAVDGRLDIMRRYLETLSEYASSLHGGSTEPGVHSDETEVGDGNHDQQPENRPSADMEPTAPASIDSDTRDPTYKPKQSSSSTPKLLPPPVDASNDFQRPIILPKDVPNDRQFKLPYERPSILALSAGGSKVAFFSGNSIIVLSAASASVLSQFSYKQQSRFFWSKSSEPELRKLMFAGEASQYLATEVLQGPDSRIDVWDWSVKVKLLSVRKPDGNCQWTTSRYQKSHRFYHGLGGNIILFHRQSDQISLSSYRLRENKTGHVKSSAKEPDHRVTSNVGSSHFSLNTPHISHKTLLGISGDGSRLLMAMSSSDGVRTVSRWPVDPVGVNSSGGMKIVWNMPSQQTDYHQPEPFCVSVSTTGTKFAVAWKLRPKDNVADQILWTIDVRLGDSSTSLLAQPSVFFSGTYPAHYIGSEHCVISSDCTLVAGVNPEGWICVRQLSLIPGPEQDEETGASEVMGRVDLVELFSFSPREQKIVEQLAFSPHCGELFVLYDDNALQIWDMEKRLK